MNRKIIEGMLDLQQTNFIIGDRIFYVDKAEAYHEGSTDEFILKVKLIKVQDARIIYKTKESNESK